MKKLNPFNWASSMLIAKFLSPYFKNIDENNVNVGFWKGDITLKKLELRHDFLILGDITLDVEGSLVSEIKINIPWSNIMNEPINIEIKGVKLCVSQEMNPNKNLNQKEDMLNELKKEALKNFDLMIKNQAKDEEVETGGGYFTTLINNIGQNITLKIQDVEVMYIFHISNKEIVKFGINMPYLEIGPCPKASFDNSQSKDIHMRKVIKLERLSVYFDVYDDSFLTKYQQKSVEAQPEELSNLHQYILNDTNLEVDIEVKLGETLELKPIIKLSPILLHFNQKQIKYLLLCIEKFVELGSTRPKVRPVDKKSVTVWWKYAVKRVMETENIQNKIFSMSFNTYVNAEKYKVLYLKKCINPNIITLSESKFMEKFETENSLAHTIQIRNIALAQIKLMNFKVRKGDKEERKNAEIWFKRFNRDFSLVQIMDINLEKRKMQELAMSIKLLVNVESVNVLVRENNIIDSLKNLQNHVNFFKTTLNKKEQLKNKVIEHIKKNFIKALNTEVNKAWSDNSNVAQKESQLDKKISTGNYNPALVLKDYLDYIKTSGDSEGSPHKFLLCLSVEGISADCRIEKMDIVASLEIKRVIGADLLGVNRQIKYFLEINSELKIYYSTRMIKLMNLKGIKDSESSQQLNLVHLDVEVPKINFTLHKPFIERLSSLNEFLTFDQDTEKWKTTFNADKNRLLYDTILRKRENIKQQMNLSVTIQKINIYLPTDYMKNSYMVVLHVDQLKLYKREHENNNEKNVIAIANAETENEFFNQDFQPLLITIQNLRGLITDNYQWEVIENPFLKHNVKGKNKKAYISTLFEILHIHFSIEKYTQMYRLANGQEVYPSQNNVVIKLPLLILNLSIKNMNILMDLIQLWTGQTAQISLHQLKKSTNKETGDSEDPLLSVDGKSESPDKKSSFQRKDKNLVKTKFVDHTLLYELNIRRILDTLVLSEVDFICEGVVVNLNLEDDFYFDAETNKYHKHSLLSVYLHSVKLKMISKYFESRFSLALQQFLIEYHMDCTERQVSRIAEKIYTQMVVDDEKEERILEEEGPHVERSIPKSTIKQTETSFLSKHQSMCAVCSGNRSNLILNFLNRDTEEQPDVLVHVSIIDDEFQRIVEKDYIQTEVGILLTDLTVSANPEAFKQIKIILDYAQLYASMRYRKFVKFMKEEAFWPEVRIEGQLNINDLIENSTKEDKGIALTQIKLHVPSVNAVFLHENEPIYLLNLQDISMEFNIYLRDSDLKLNVRDLVFYNTSKIAGPHNQIISVLNPTEGSYALSFQMKGYGKYQAAVKNFSSWLGIKLSGVKIVFLKRVVMEFVEYLLKNLLESFSPQVKELRDIVLNTEQPRSELKLELVVLDSVVELFRNSIDSDCLLLQFEQVGLWSCGKWGDYEGYLIENGKFEDEDRNEFSNVNDTKEFHDARGTHEGYIDDLSSPNSFQDLGGATPKRENRNEKPSDDIFKIRILGVEIKTQEGAEDAIFLKLAKESILLDLILQDTSYPIGPGEDYPLKSNTSGLIIFSSHLIVLIMISSLKMFAYEPDFTLFMKLLQENLGESPQVVVSKDPPPSPTNKAASIVVDVQVHEGLIKIFNGSRHDLRKKFKKEVFEREDYLRDFIYKNPNSLALLTIERVHVKFTMMVNGDKVMTLNIKQMDMYDIRQRSKITKECRKILSSLIAKFKFDEETTSYIELDHFDPEPYEDFDIDLGNASQESEQHEILNSELHNTVLEPKKSLKQMGPSKSKPDQKLVRKSTPNPDEEKKPLRQKMSGFFNGLFSCLKRKPKEQIEDTQKQKVDLVIGNEEVKLQNPPVPALRKEGSLLFNPDEDPNAFVIEKEKDHQQFLSQSDKIIIDALDKDFHLNDSAGVAEAKKDSRVDRAASHISPNERIEASSFRENKGRKFIISHESEIKPSKLRDVDYGEWAADSEIFLYFEADSEGEKNILISLNNKSIVVAKDFLIAVTNFFKKPFTDSIDPPYVRQMVFNNFPPMKVKIALNSLALVFLSKFDTLEDNQALTLITSVIYTQEGYGDAGFGPGRTQMGVEVLLKRLLFVNSKDIFVKTTLPLSKLDEYQNFFSLIETFKIYFSQTYSLPYYLKYKATPATSDLRVEIKNNKRLVHNFVLSTDHLNLLQKVAENVMSSTLDSKEEVVFAQSNVPSPYPQPEVISTYLIKVNRIRINIIKMVQGMELLHIQFSKIILKSLQEKDQTLMKCKMILDIEYFNRLKIAFEPLLEPWEFMIKFDKKEKENVIELCNVEPPFDPTLDLRQQHLNKNALNLNVSTSAIGTILELVKLITGKMEEADPYKIKNYTGFSVTLYNSNMTDAKTNTSINLDDKQTKDLDWRFFRKPKRKYKYVSDVNTKSYLDMEIRGRKKKIPILSSNTLHDLETATNTIHEFTTSQYKKIKDIDCDLIGKRFYKLKSDLSMEATSLTKKQGRHFDFPFFSSKKAAEITSTYMICSVHINPLTATKEVVLRSTAILKNYLNVALKVKFNYKSRITKTDEVIEEEIEPQGKYYLPIEVIEEKTLIYFGTEGFEYSDKFNLKETIQNKDFLNENEEEEDDLELEKITKDPTLEPDKRRKYKKDHLILCRSDTENKSFNFVLTVSKKKVLPAEAGLQNVANKDDLCYETVLLVNPLISLTNATVKPIRFTFLKESTPGIPLLSLPPLAPGNFAQITELGFEEDLLVNFHLDHYETTKSRKVFKKMIRDRYCTIFKPIHAKEFKTKCKLYLWVEITKKSNQSRNIVIFCPYLIINETYQNLKYQERVFGFGKPSEDPTLLAMESLKIKSLKSGIRGQEAYAAARSDFRAAVDTLKNQVDEEGEEDIYDKIHMFSTSRRMNKLQIALRDTKNWSKPFSLQSASGSVHLIESLRDSKERDKDKNSGFRLLGRVSNTWNNVAKYLKKKPQKEQLNKRKKYEFGVRTEVAPGLFHRSRLIILTPRFAIKNESGQNLMLAQYENVIQDESIMRLKHNAWGFFHWTDSKKPNNVVMSLSDSLLQKPYAWSGRFKIDQVGDFTVKLKQDKKESLRVWNNEDHYYARMVITLEGSIVVIRILPEDLNNPPYKIQNNTLYDISFRQKPLANSKDKKPYTDNAPFYKLAPDKTVTFSWDEMIGEKLLEIEIESVSAEYNLDTIKDYEPIPLGKLPEASATRNGKFLLKKGYLGRKKPYDEEYEDEYCVLSIAKQRLKLYNKKHPNIKEKIPLKGAKIEDMKDVRFILNVEVNKRPKFIEFKARNEDDAIEWVEFIKRAAFVHGPNIVYVKIDPVNSTKVIKFQMIKENKKSDEDEWLQLEEKKKNRYASTIYKLAITNTIGISVIDSHPREIIHITITNLNFTQTILNETVQKGENEGYYMDEIQEAIQWERQNMLFTIDSITINNQLHDTQFPVMLARNKKNTKNLPLVFLTYYSKNMTNTKINSTLNYIFEFKGFLDTMEVRLDDYLIFALLSMYSQIPFIEDAQSFHRPVKIYDPKPLQTKLDDKIIQLIEDNKRVYIKLLRLEPIDLTFTFRNSPGQKYNQTTSYFLADFGLSLVTLDSAKIRLNHLFGTHIFGSTSEIVGRITKHYSRQFWTQLYKLFGSIEILGNPISLIENLGIGVVELFYEPLHALVTGNQTSRGLRFGQSLAYGVKSFFEHALLGIAEALTKILRGITNGLAAMTADKQYLQLRQRQKNTRIRTIKEGVVFGCKNFASVLWDTLIGIFTKPYLEYKKRGFLGIFRGIYTGFISIILKPLIGLYDLIASLVYGIKNTAKYEEHIMEARTRPPRLFGENQLVVNYDWGAATAQDVIRRLKNTKRYDHEKILIYDEIKVAKFPKRRSTANYQVILTDVRFLYARMHNNLNYTEVKLYKIKNVKYNKEKNNLEINLLVPVKRHKYKLSFSYESYEKAKKLLEEFGRQGLLAESQILE